MKTLTPNLISICDNTLRSRGLYAPNKAIVAAIVSTMEPLVDSLLEYYKDCGPDAKLDTYERDYLMEAVAQHYCQMAWPCNMDTSEYVLAFREKMIDHAGMAGWGFA